MRLLSLASIAAGCTGSSPAAECSHDADSPHALASGCIELSSIEDACGSTPSHVRYSENGRCPTFMSLLEAAGWLEGRADPWGTLEPYRCEVDGAPFDVVSRGCTDDVPPCDIWIFDGAGRLVAYRHDPEHSDPEQAEQCCDGVWTSSADWFGAPVDLGDCGPNGAIYYHPDDF